MKKVANIIMDLTDELNNRNIDYLHEVLSCLPESVKTASLSKEDISDDDFAVILYHPSTGFLHKFAIFSPELTQINLELFNRKEKELPDEIVKIAEHNLKAAARYYKLAEYENIEKIDFIPNKVNLEKIDHIAYKRKLDKLAEVNLPDRFAIPEENRFPIHDEKHVKKACDFFKEAYLSLTIPNRIEYAKNVKLALSDFNMPEDKLISKYASLSLDTRAESLESGISARKSLVVEEKSKKAYDVFLSKIASIDENRLNLLPVATILEEIDNSTGVKKYYNKNIPDAALTVFGTKKEASVILSNGDVLTRKSLDNILEKTAEQHILNDELQDALKGPNGLNVFKVLPSTLQKKLLNNA